MRRFTAPTRMSICLVVDIAGRGERRCRAGRGGAVKFDFADRVHEARRKEQKD